MLPEFQHELAEHGHCAATKLFCWQQKSAHHVGSKVAGSPIWGWAVWKAAICPNVSPGALAGTAPTAAPSVMTIPAAPTGSPVEGSPAPGCWPNEVLATCRSVPATALPRPGSRPSLLQAAHQASMGTAEWAKALLHNPPDVSSQGLEVPSWWQLQACLWHTRYHHG